MESVSPPTCSSQAWFVILNSILPSGTVLWKNSFYKHNPCQAIFSPLLPYNIDIILGEQLQFNIQSKLFSTLQNLYHPQVDHRDFGDSSFIIWDLLTARYWTWRTDNYQRITKYFMNRQKQSLKAKPWKAGARTKKSSHVIIILV